MTESDIQQTWAYVTGPVPRLFVEDPPAKAAFERAERLNAAARAVAEGFVPVHGCPVLVQWQELNDVGIEMLARVARDLDGRVSEPDFLEATEDEIVAEEKRRRTALRGTQTMRVEFAVWAKPEKPRLVSMSEDTHAELVRQGAEVLADKDRSVLLCGGALRRHKFPPREAAWLRDGAIQGARCMDCDQRVTRDELLERQEREQANGWCLTCGDAIVVPAGESRIAGYCPTCRTAGRE